MNKLYVSARMKSREGKPEGFKKQAIIKGDIKFVNRVIWLKDGEFAERGA